MGDGAGLAPLSEGRRHYSAMIHFAARQSRCGLAGARRDFEEMLGLPIQTTDPTARLIAANPGDWRIAVVVGDLDGGDVEVFPAKYFYPLVETDHQQQLRDSLKAAINASGPRTQSGSHVGAGEKLVGGGVADATRRAHRDVDRAGGAARIGGHDFGI